MCYSLETPIAVFFIEDLIDFMTRRMTYQEAMESIIEFFDGNKDKAIAWWIAPNADFNNDSPFHMIRMGKGKELMEYLQTRLSIGMEVL